VGETSLGQVTFSESTQASYRTTAYAELCRSYLALHDFRMKLLGLLPIASVVGLLALGKAMPASPQPELQPEAVGYIGIFSGIFTLALFGYEARSLLMCHDYRLTGAYLEDAMNIEGQFTQCNETRQFECYRGRFKRPLARLVNDKVTSSLVYSFVFAAWFFVGLRYAFDMHPQKCVWWAVGMGAVVLSAALLFLRTLTREPEKTSHAVSDEAVVVVVTGHAVRIERSVP